MKKKRRQLFNPSKLKIKINFDVYSCVQKARKPAQISKQAREGYEEYRGGGDKIGTKIKLSQLTGL